MPPTEPDSATIDAWLAGELSDDESAAVERWFEEHPESLPAELAEAAANDDLLEELAAAEADEELTDLVKKVKTHGPDVAKRAASGELWKEVLSPSDVPELLGMIGDYEVIELIATGGMGIVFKARDPKLRRIAAVKVLAPDLAVNATARERFLREARAAAKLEHENILPIYGVHDEGVPYFAMRHGSGGTLQDKLDAEENFDLDQLKSLARQVASALGAAHAEGFVHRDIKPANILFEEDGEQLWVCDFGIARSTEDPSLTYPGAIAGTPQFMSPEQAAGEELDGRSDLFSLGAVLHRCATGLHAFTGVTTAAVLGQLGSDQPTTIAPPKKKLPPWFRRLLTNLLAKDPRDRPKSAAAVVKAIDDEHSSRPKHTARRNRRLAITGISIAAITGLVFGLLQIPAVTRTANRLLATQHDQAFWIAGKLGAYPSLGRAAAAAGDGDTIELPAGEPIAVDNLRIPAGKALTLTSARPDARPVLTTNSAGIPGIITSSPLRVAGLDFKLNPRRDSDGILIVDGTSLVVENCRFMASRDVLNPYSDIKSRAVELRGESSAEITACEFDLEETNAITIRGGTAAVRIRDSRIAAFFAINLYEYVSTDRKVKIEASDSSFTGQSFLKGHSGGGLPEISCETAACVFTTARSLSWFQTDEVAASERLAWSGSGNTHRLGNAHLQIGASSQMRLAASIEPLDESMRSGDSEMGTIEIAQTGEQFTDFATAFRKAPTSSTLLVSGRIICSEETLAPSDKTFQLRAAPDAEAVVIASAPVGHALFFFGPTTVAGIRFSRPDASPNGLPIVGIKAGGGDVLIEDCQFDAGPSFPDGRDTGIGLGLTDVGTATVRRCAFRCGRGLFVAFVNPEPRPTTIHLEGCLFTGHSAIQCVSRVPETDLTLLADRCVVACEFLLTKNPQIAIDPLEVSFTDSILDLRTSLIRFPDCSLESVRTHFSWNGKNNHYRREVAGLLLPQNGSGSGGRQSTELDRLETFFGALPRAEDHGGQFGAPFDRTRLHSPVTPAALLEAIDPALVSPAVETIEQLMEPSKLGHD